MPPVFQVDGRHEGQSEVEARVDRRRSSRLTEALTGPCVLGSYLLPGGASGRRSLRAGSASSS